MYSVGVAKKSSVLGGHVYVVEEADDGLYLVHKLPRNDSEEPEIYTVDADSVCTCRAGDFGNECKHAGMVDGSLMGLEMAKRRASDLLEAYLDKVREDWPRAQIMSLLPFKPGRRLAAATALAFGVLDDASAEKLVLWGEYKGLLIRLHCFRDRDRYRRALRKARTKHEERRD